MKLLKQGTKKIVQLKWNEKKGGNCVVYLYPSSILLAITSDIVYSSPHTAMCEEMKTDIRHQQQAAAAVVVQKRNSLCIYEFHKHML